VTDEARMAWIDAFVQAQALMPNPSKEKTAVVVTKEKGTYSYTYADLAEVVEVARPILAAHGLAFTQDIVIEDQWLRLTTKVMHKAGHVESFGPLVVPVGATPQATGSTLTYLRRYAILSSLGLAPTDDDDAASATKSAPSQRGRGKDADSRVRGYKGKGPEPDTTSASPDSDADGPGSDAGGARSGPTTSDAGAPTAETSQDPSAVAAADASDDPAPEAKGPSPSPSGRRVCMHLMGTETVKNSRGEYVEVCVECRRPIEVSA
jgi:hypothetical protein